MVRSLTFDALIDPHIDPVWTQRAPGVCGAIWVCCFILVSDSAFGLINRGMTDRVKRAVNKLQRWELGAVECMCWETLDGQNLTSL